jgi:glycosidase
LLLTLKGTPFLYNGEEIGMTDHMISDPSLFRDPLSTLFYGWAKSLLGMNEEEAINVGAIRGRDKCRTPMQWNSTANGGFCSKGVNPWLPVNPNFSQSVNVEDQAKIDGSLLTFYKKMLRVRKNSKVLQLGDYSTLDTENPLIHIFKRSLQNDVIWVLLNMTPKPQNIDLNRGLEKKNILISSYGSVEVTNFSHCRLQPYQGIIIC